MTQLTDGKKTVEISMSEWIGTEYTPDWSNDFFGTGSLPLVWVDALNEEAHKVEDVDHCIDQAKDWENYTGDFYDPESQEWNIENGIERYVEVNILA